MSKAAVEALQASDGVHLSAPLKLSPPKDAATKVGLESFEAPLITPLSSTGLMADLSFQDGKLVLLYIKLDESSSMLERVKAQIEEKYGPGVVDDTREEGQCIYKNGSNFRITSGAVTTRWTEVISPEAMAQTSILDMAINFCPSNLRTDGIGGIKLRSLSISQINSNQEVKPKNLF